MTLLISALGGLVVGLLVGGLGGGGAILTVPLLVYALNQPPQVATTSSLVIVAISSLGGLWLHHRSGHVRWGQGAFFGILGVGGAWLGSTASHGMDGDLLLALFAGLLLVVAAAMIHRSRHPGENVGCEHHPLLDGGHLNSAAALKVALTGTGVGLLTGFFGVGGGFAIVPALTLALGYCMADAVGTSLLVIVLNSVAAFAFHAGNGSTINWAIVGPLVVTAVLGALLGGRLMSHVPKHTLQLGFASFLICVALYTAARSIPHLL